MWTTASFVEIQWKWTFLQPLSLWTHVGFYMNSFSALIVLNVLNGQWTYVWIYVWTFKKKNLCSLYLYCKNFVNARLLFLLRAYETCIFFAHWSCTSLIPKRSTCLSLHISIYLDNLKISLCTYWTSTVRWPAAMSHGYIQIKHFLKSTRFGTSNSLNTMVN